LALLLHVLGLVIFFDSLVFLALVKGGGLKKLLIPMFVFWLIIVGVFWQSLQNITGVFSKTNNFSYYRVFLTHNYFFITLFSFLGLVCVGIKKKYKILTIFVVVLGIQLVVASLLLSKPFTRYLVIIFPFFVLLSVVFLYDFSRQVRRRFVSDLFLALIFILLIFFMRDKFSFSPEKIYSLDEDMRETPEVDWKRVYGFVGNKLNQNWDAVLIVNWSDLPVWYLGEGRVNYLVRSDIHQETDTFSGARVISSVSRLEQVVNKEGKGLVVIDSWDDRVPVRVREYIKSNLVKELEVDRLYPVQPRYWPVEVYSWGFN
jgi:hypothetical protein